MAETQAELEAKLAAIKEARDSGVLMVRHGETSTQFRTLAEMDSIIGSISRDLAAITGQPPKRSNVNYITQWTKGYD